MDQQTILSVCRRYRMETPRVLRRGGGTAGASFIIDSGGERFLVRVRSEEHARDDQIAFEHDLLRALDDAGFPVAAPVVTQDGKTWVAESERIVEVIPWIDGDAFDPGSEEQVKELGRQLAVFHDITSPIMDRKEKPREDDPHRLIEDLAALLKEVDASGHEGLLSQLRDRLAHLGDKLRRTVYDRLPQAVIHGDLHPGNVKFKGNRLVGVFDFDWANRQERLRDVGDAILFFAARQRSFDPDDIWSLTQASVVEGPPVATLLGAYESVSPLTSGEKEALPDVMAARWMQVRIRGMRKVAPQQRIRFLDRCDLLAVADHIQRFRAP